MAAGSKSTTTAVWSEGLSPAGLFLRASRSTSAEVQRAAEPGGDQQEVDAHALPLVEGAAAVVPPAEDPAVGVELGEHVDQPPVHHRGQRLALGGAHVGEALEGRRVPDVGVTRRHVEVAAHRHVVGRVARLGQVVAQPGQPGQLDLEVLAVQAPPVGHVDRVDPHPATGGGHYPATVIVIGCPEPLHRVDHPDPTDDGHAVPLALAVVDRLVAELGEGGGREGGIGLLGLLQAEDVGPVGLDPGGDQGETGAQRVDVPGDQPHGARLRPRRRPG